MLDLQLTYSPYVNRKYSEFYKNKRYIPKYFSPFNTQEVKRYCPTLSTHSGAIGGMGGGINYPTK